MIKLKVVQNSSLFKQIVNTIKENSLLLRFLSHSYHIPLHMSDSKDQIINQPALSDVKVKYKKNWKTDPEMKEERKKNLKLRRQAKRENKTAGFTNDILKQTQYYFENGLRKVYPYHFG
jgi:hypothetical protein